jgi:hypothetical protein
MYDLLHSLVKANSHRRLAANQVDVRQARVRDLLQDDGQRRDEVLDEVEYRAMQAPAGRHLVRGHLRELLRRLHVERLRDLAERCFCRLIVLAWRTSAEARGGRRLLSGFRSFLVRLTPIACMLSAVVLCGCGGGDAPATQRARDADALVERVKIGRTTADDITRQFGVADEHAPDGALVYHLRAAGQDRGKRDRSETLTFRFERGVLSRICRARP